MKRVLIINNKYRITKKVKKVLGNTKTSFREKGSKFIGCLFPAETRDAFGSELSHIKSTYPDATHHCYAWRLNPLEIEEWAHDDGEPGGTAGPPILNQLKSFEVVNAGLVVVRYYGGTNLGKSGLIQAYGHAADECLRQARLQPLQLFWKVKMEYPYREQNTIETMKHQFDLKELDASYTEIVSLVLGCPLPHKKTLENKLSQLAHRHIETEFLGKDYQ